MEAQANLLDQETFWVNVKGKVLRLEEMDVEYCANLIPFLRGNIRTLWSYYGNDESPPGDLEGWLLNTRLMQYLLRRTKDLDREAWQVIEEQNTAYRALTGYENVRQG